MGLGVTRKGQDKKRIRERERENRKDRRQTLVCHATWYGLRWYGHMKRREAGGKSMMEMAVPGRRKTGRPRRRWMDLTREDMERVGAKERDEVDREKWKIFSRCGDPE